MDESMQDTFQRQKNLIGSRHGRFIHTFVAQGELKHDHKVIGSPKESPLFYCAVFLYHFLKILLYLIRYANHNSKQHSQVKLIFFVAFKLVITINFGLHCGLMKKKTLQVSKKAEVPAW